MADSRDSLATQLAASLDRRAAVKTYVPPAAAALVLATRTTHGPSGSTIKPNAGRGNGPEGNPDSDPGNSGKNNGGDGVVSPPGKGNPHR